LISIEQCSMPRSMFMGGQYTGKTPDPIVCW
jgi:hypothetical protein